MPRLARAPAPAEAVAQPVFVSGQRLDQALALASARIGGAEARREAEILIGHALGCSRAALFAHGDRRLDQPELEAIERLVAARAAGQPVAYLLGEREFFGLPFTVTEAVLIPRPETELLVELALARLPVDASGAIADLGTGSGAIAIVLAKLRPGLRVWALERSPEALAVAHCNARRYQLPNLHLLESDWLSALPPATRLRMLVANPPYVAADDPHLDCGDLRFEPRMALTPGADALAAYRAITAAAGAFLETGAWVLFEHGEQQGPALRALLAKRGFTEISSERDLEGRERVSLGRWP